MSVHGLPSSTEIKKLVHKKLLYAKFPKELCGERRKQFDDDIGRIVVTNEISPVSVNIKEGEQVKSIFVLQVELKTKAYNERNIVLISKLFGQHLSDWERLNEIIQKNGKNICIFLLLFV